MKLKIQAFKKSGKFYAENTFNISQYPSEGVNLKERQIDYCYNLWENIKKGYIDELSPTINGFNGYIYHFDAIFENDEEGGFLTYILDRTEEEVKTKTHNKGTFVFLDDDIFDAVESIENIKAQLDDDSKYVLLTEVIGDNSLKKTMLLKNLITEAKEKD